MVLGQERGSAVVKLALANNEHLDVSRKLQQCVCPAGGWEGHLEAKHERAEHRWAEDGDGVVGMEPDSKRRELEDAEGNEGRLGQQSKSQIENGQAQARLPDIPKTYNVEPIEHTMMNFIFFLFLSLLSIHSSSCVNQESNMHQAELCQCLPSR
jgi:hypothetical protein